MSHTDKEGFDDVFQYMLDEDEDYDVGLIDSKKDSRKNDGSYTNAQSGSKTASPVSYLTSETDDDDLPELDDDWTDLEVAYDHEDTADDSEEDEDQQFSLDDVQYEEERFEFEFNSDPEGLNLTFDLDEDVEESDETESEDLENNDGDTEDDIEKMPYDEELDFTFDLDDEDEDSEEDTSIDENLSEVSEGLNLSFDLENYDEEVSSEEDEDYGLSVNFEGLDEEDESSDHSIKGGSSSSLFDEEEFEDEEPEIDLSSMEEEEPDRSEDLEDELEPEDFPDEESLDDEPKAKGFGLLSKISLPSGNKKELAKSKWTEFKSAVAAEMKGEDYDPNSSKKNSDENEDETPKRNRGSSAALSGKPKQLISLLLWPYNKIAQLIQTALGFVFGVLSKTPIVGRFIEALSSEKILRPVSLVLPLVLIGWFGYSSNVNAVASQFDVPLPDEASAKVTDLKFDEATNTVSGSIINTGEVQIEVQPVFVVHTSKATHPMSFFKPKPEVECVGKSTVLGMKPVKVSAKCPQKVEGFFPKVSSDLR